MELGSTGVAAVKFLVIKRKGKLWGRKFNIDCICFFCVFLLTSNTERSRKNQNVFTPLSLLMGRIIRNVLVQ